MPFVIKNVSIDTTKLAPEKIPAGHSVATTVSSLGGTGAITELYTWDLLASDSVAATETAGFDDLLNTELVADIDAFISASTGLGIDIASHLVWYNARVTNINYGAGTDIYLASTHVQFKVSFELKVWIIF